MNDELRRELDHAAARLGVEPAALAAVADIESGLQSFAAVDGGQRPLIRFEGHYFDRRLDGEARLAARAAGLASPSAGAIANPASQAARWRLLDAACAIDAKAAYESTSWGLGQVMGAHWAWLDYPSVDALAEAAHSVAGQLVMMERYIRKAGLADALRRHDWAAFAHGYNGPAFSRNAYDRRLHQAYLRHAGNRPGAGRPLLRRGMRGDAVRALQTALRDAGERLTIDGVFGPETESALRMFQRRHALLVDGIAGPQSWQALAQHPGPADNADQPAVAWQSIGDAIMRWLAVFRLAMRL